MDDLLGSVTRGLTTDNLADVQSQAQIAVVKQAQDQQVQQVQQLVESVDKPRPVSPGQPGGVINTKA